MVETRNLESKFDPSNITIENELYMSMRGLCEDAEPVEKLSVSVKEETDSIEDVYNRVLENGKITILTPLEKFTQKIQKLEYRCNVCGAVSHARFDLLLPGSIKFPSCKKCEKRAKKIERETYLFMRAGAFIAGRGGHIVQQEKKGEHYTREDRIRVECAYGHRWNTKFRHILNNHWCRFCARDEGIEVEEVKALDARKLKGPMRFHVLSRMVGTSGMQMHFRAPGDRYCLICRKCKTATILNEPQIRTRKYLCPNRCTKALQISLPRYFAMYGINLQEMQWPDKIKEMDAKFKEAKKNYELYKVKQLDIPVPKVATTRSKRL